MDNVSSPMSNYTAASRHGKGGAGIEVKCGVE
jgi:hypothetical protein